MNTNACSHWACHREDYTCVRCGAIIRPKCLKEPENCKCENKDIYGVCEMDQTTFVDSLAFLVSSPYLFRVYIHKQANLTTI